MRHSVTLLLVGGHQTPGGIEVLWAERRDEQPHPGRVVWLPADEQYRSPRLTVLASL